eukprot:TRINITY_DN2007_c0_g1_i1.p1 TRINITY_DN2007_c0_g1~~TRINITY_DN2007_c0_g1_i1.p1  ORF type:complete len:281 (+),score=95.57 TRINITY_DN2007_c0_g1_i1:185-1027(+)
MTQVTDYTRKEFDPPIVTKGFFPDSDEEDNGSNNIQDESTEKQFNICDETMTIREFVFSSTNANFVWPNNSVLGSFLMQNSSSFEGRNILEIGSGTGILSILLRKKGFAVVSCDYNDEEGEIERNIEHNCVTNNKTNVCSLHHHVPHTWGNPFPYAKYHHEREALVEEMSAQGTTTLKLPISDRLDVIIATDILIYVEQYPNLVSTLVELLITNQQKDNSTISSKRRSVTLDGKEFTIPFFLMNIGRRLDSTPHFLDLMKNAGFKCTHLNKTLYIFEVVN